MIVDERERFNTNHPDLCPSLRWKRIYLNVEPDPTVPPCNDGNFWCVHTRTASSRSPAIAGRIESVTPANVADFSGCRR
jgi:hypothetical protein